MVKESHKKGSGVEARLRETRVARLATADDRSRAHVVPVCYAYDGKFFYTPLDRKPKKKAATELARVRNILANPEVALLLDQYEEDWSRLWYILVHGRAKLLSSGEERKKALELLRQKYSQYASLELLPADAAVIRITPDRVVSWGRA
jgi:PPOX class probable F420-dependent enzyme